MVEKVWRRIHSFRYTIRQCDGRTDGQNC